MRWVFSFQQPWHYFKLNKNHWARLTLGCATDVLAFFQLFPATETSASPVCPSLPFTPAYVQHYATYRHIEGSLCCSMSSRYLHVIYNIGPARTMLGPLRGIGNLHTHECSIETKPHSYSTRWFSSAPQKMQGPAATLRPWAAAWLGQCLDAFKLRGCLVHQWASYFKVRDLYNLLLMDSRALSGV